MGGSQNLRRTAAAEQSVTGFEKRFDDIARLNGLFPA
jgi:hypothetical protein